MVGNQANLQSAQTALPAAAHPSRANGSDGLDRLPDHSAYFSISSQTNWTAWSNLWQIPTIILSAALIGLGILHATRDSSSADVSANLAHCEQLVAAGEYKAGAVILRTLVEPHVEGASTSIQARFHVLAGDLMYLSQRAEGVEDTANFRRASEQYQTATKLGADLTPHQLERWADCDLALGESILARARLDALEEQAAAGTTTAEEASAVHNRLFRKIVEHALTRAEIDFTQLMQTVSEYRASQALSADDELWAVARMAQLRLEAGQHPQAVDYLLVEMRRLEGRDIDAEGFGDLYALLGRGYFELGDYERAQQHLEHALTSIGEPRASRGDALVLLGQIAASRGDVEAALDRFQIVARDFKATPSYLAGMLGLAESRSVMSDHDGSLGDYDLLRQELQKARRGDHGRSAVSAERVAESLCDRHDASLTMGKIKQALAYVVLAEKFFTQEQTPGDVLFRIASTTRQLAEDVRAQMLASNQLYEAFDAPQNPISLHAETNRIFERAGDYFLRHSNGRRSFTQSDDAWATSLWLAADSYDLAGRHDLATQYFVNYLDRRPIDDQRRAETVFRLAQSYHAQLLFDKAISSYEQVVADHARSPFAPQCYVPLARCYVAVDRRPEAIAQLRQVLSGDRLLKPDARDYREALIELGRLHHNAAEFNQAIVLFTEAMQRYPTDPQRLDILFLLADSYRGAATTIDDRLTNEPAISATDVGQLTALRHTHLQSALMKFAEVCDGYGSRMNARPTQLEQDQFRRARLYRADCAFHLGQYEQAIELYDQITRQYSAHHSAMYALIQIVNCYRSMGDQERTEAAHRRALARLRQLPDSAFAAPDALMDRTAWERWLELMPAAPSRTAAVSAPTG